MRCRRVRTVGEKLLWVWFWSVGEEFEAGDCFLKGLVESGVGQ
jgi:hypothetical protein